MRAVERNPGNSRGLPVCLQYYPCQWVPESPAWSSSQRLGCSHAAPGPGHGGQAPGPLPCPGTQLSVPMRAGPLRLSEEGDGGAGGRWTDELGEVVSLFTFTGVLVRELQGEDTDQGLGNGMELGGKESCRALAETIADYLGEEKSDWMLENKGWVGLSSKHHTH
ncbi:unnamed protein product, partial [Oncorhynchus mykiss]